MHSAFDRTQLPDAVSEESSQRAVRRSSSERQLRGLSGQALPLWRDHIEHLQKPVDWQLQGTSSWINLVNGRDGVAPKGWKPDAES